MDFAPKFNITPVLSRVLMDMEASRQAVGALPITVPLLESLRESARLTATHYSTQIEGNRLTREQVGEVLQGGSFPNRERDERDRSPLLRELSQRQRQVLSLFREYRFVTTKEVADLLHIHRC